MYLVEIVLFSYIAYIASYLLFYGFGGHLYKRQIALDSNFQPLRFAILVPGYKEDAVILSTVSNNLKVDYPAASFDLFVIADSFQPETLEALNKLDCNTIEVSFEKSTKVKALKKAFRKYPTLGLTTEAFG